MYYLIEITNYTDGTPVSKGIYEYATQDEAVANYHTKMGGAMKNAKYASELLIVISNTGAVVENGYYVRPIAEPEPVEE